MPAISDGEARTSRAGTQTQAPPRHNRTKEKERSVFTCRVKKRCHDIPFYLQDGGRPPKTPALYMLVIA